MDMQIAASTMAMAMMNIQSGSAVSMLKETLEASEEALTEMLEKMPSPDGRGLLLDIRV